MSECKFLKDRAYLHKKNFVFPTDHGHRKLLTMSLLVYLIIGPIVISKFSKFTVFFNEKRQNR